MIYLKFSNGAVSQLINVENEVAQAEAIDNGFKLVREADGSPAIVDSNTLLKKNANKGRSSIMDEVLKKLGRDR